MSIVLIKILQSILFLSLAPLLSGWIKALKCLLQNRKPPSIFQPYRNLFKLIRKQAIVPKEASWVFRFAPYIIFSVTVLAGFIIPLFYVNPDPTANFAIADVIVLIGLFALARFFLVLAGMDIGTTFGGMGSSREMLISSLAEPSALLVFFTLAMVASSTNLAVIISHLVHGRFIFGPSFIFALFSFVMVTIAETGRIPIDNPYTHLELTMTHEAMILEYSGKYLALVEWAAQLKLMLYFALISNIFFPWGIATNLAVKNLALSLGIIIVKLFFCGIVLVIAETGLAKMRLFKAPYFLGAAFILCLLAILSHIILGVG